MSLCQSPRVSAYLNAQTSILWKDPGHALLNHLASPNYGDRDDVGVCVIGKMVSVMKSGRPYDAFLAHLLEQANTLKQSSMKLALVPILSTLATKCYALV